VLIFESTNKNDEFRACAALPRCTSEPVASPVPAHLAPDPARARWLETFTGFVEGRIDERDHAA
jgi:hypothetical protein